MTLPGVVVLSCLLACITKFSNVEEFRRFFFTTSGVIRDILYYFFPSFLGLIINSNIFKTMVGMNDSSNFDRIKGNVR